MHYVAIVGGEEREVEVTELAPGRYRVTIGERVVEADAHAVNGRSLSLIVDGGSYAVQLDRAPRGDVVLLRGHRVHAEVLDLRQIRLRRAQSLAHPQDGPREVLAPMPGKVVAVLVREDESVLEGQGLVVIEAMKMENELRSPKAGIVRRVAVQAGTAVDGGALLCIVD